jgi:predicted dehydrogenase
MLNIAIVGLGHFGQRLVEAVNAHSHKVRFTMAVAPRHERVRDFAAANHLVLTSDYESVLANPTIAGVVSCGPAHLHAAHSLQALKAGKPVLGVKPMALSGADAAALQAAAGQRGLVLALGYDRCFMPNVAHLRAELKAGTLGELLHSEGDFCVHRYHRFKHGEWKGDPLSSPPGGLADHMLYLTIEALGAVAQVHALSRFDVTDNGLADSTAVLMRMQNGSSAFLTAIGATPNYHRFQVFGTKGWAELRGSNSFRLQTTDGRRVDENLPEAEPELLEIEAFADAITGRAPFPVAQDEAVHAVAVLEAIAQSANERRVVDVRSRQ